MQQRIRIFLLAMLALSIVSLVSPSEAQVLEQDTATVCMSVDVRASITGLDDITLSAQGKDGDAGTLYVGSDEFTLESNAPVQIEVTGIQLSNGPSVLNTNFKIDGGQASLITGDSGTYVGTHTITASARLGAISEQLAGDYSATVVVTVIPLVSEIQVCEEVVDEQSIETKNTEQQLAEDSNESDTTGGDGSTNYLVDHIDSTIPPELWQLINSGRNLDRYPYLQEFLRWREQANRPLSSEARYWWMFQNRHQ